MEKDELLAPALGGGRYDLRPLRICGKCCQAIIRHIEKIRVQVEKCVSHQPPIEDSVYVLGLQCTFVGTFVLCTVGGFESRAFKPVRNTF